VNEYLLLHVINASYDTRRKVKWLQLGN